MSEFDSIFNAAEKHSALIFEAERYLWKHPETGFCEWNTSKYLAKQYEALGYKVNLAGEIPGFTVDIDTRRPGPRILIFGEMDALVVPDHPECEKETGRVHACGHHVQSANLLGIAAALTEPGMLDGLCSSIRLCAVPAEELIELNFRDTLRQKNVIKYYGGKTEFLRRGLLDGCDIAYMIHGGTGKRGFYIGKGHNGCVTKNITFKGKAAHAGDGAGRAVNALYAANLGLSAINALRETFADEDHVRVHPIITHGGDMVNTIPHRVTMESYTRGATLECMETVNNKVNCALACSAAAIGANVEICDRPGYTPEINDPTLSEIMLTAMKAVVPESCVYYDRGGWSRGSTDMGDISALIPCVHPYGSGSAGTEHGNDYYVADREAACMDSVKAQLVLMNLLLRDGAKEAYRVMENFTPRYRTKEEFFAEIDKFIKDGDCVTYRDGVTEIR